MRLRPSTFLALSLVAVSADGRAAQTGEPSLSFAAASIKPAQPNEQSVIWRRPGGRLEATATTVRTFIKWAYEISDEQLSKAPDWLDRDKFDIVATPEQNAGGEQVSRDRQLRAMVQTLLAERFALKMHQESREISAFALTTVQGAHHPAPTTHEPGPQFRVAGKDRLRMLTFQAAPMSYVTRWLSTQVQRLVLDKTGLNGTYDLELSFFPETLKANLPDGDVKSPLAELMEGPSIFTALQRDAGLKLEPRKMNTAIWIIDKVMPPSEN
jgi:uncharacterized protein (TIGR03435 family)